MSAERSWIGDPQPPKEWHTRVVTHVKDRLEESETLQQQAQNNTLAQFSASPDLHSEFLSAVIGAMDSSADLSAQILTTPSCHRSSSPSLCRSSTRD